MTKEEAHRVVNELFDSYSEYAKQKMTNEDIAEILCEIAKNILLADQIRKVHSCYDCGKSETCEHRPDRWKIPRYNCFAWEEQND